MICICCKRKEAIIWVGDESEGWCFDCFLRGLEVKKALLEAERIISNSKERR